MTSFFNYHSGTVSPPLLSVNTLLSLDGTNTFKSYLFSFICPFHPTPRLTLHRDPTPFDDPRRTTQLSTGVFRSKTPSTRLLVVVLPDLLLLLSPNSGSGLSPSPVSVQHSTQNPVPPRHPLLSSTREYMEQETT